MAPSILNKAWAKATSSALRILISCSVALGPLATSVSAADEPYFRFNPGQGNVAPGSPDASTNFPGAVRGEGDLAVYSPLRIRARPNVDFNLQLYATDPSGTVTWTNVGAPLPPGISVSTSGLLSGRPTQVADYSGIIIRGVDGSGRQGTTQPFTVQVKPIPTVSVAASNGVLSGKSLTVTPAVSDLYGSQTWSLTGKLPSGMRADPVTGLISGTPETRGTYDGLVLRVTDADGAVGLSNPFAVKVDGAMTVSGVRGTYQARIGTPIANVRAFVNGNAGPVTWAMSQTGSALPPGLSLDTYGGTVSGAIAARGTYSNLVMRAEDSATGERAAATPFQVTVGGTPAVSVGSSYLARLNTPFSMTPQSSDYLGGASWSVSGDLPAGLQVDSAIGTVSGKPLGIGMASGLVATAVDLFDGTPASSGPFSIRVLPTLSVEAPKPPVFGVNVPLVLPPPLVRGLQGSPVWTLSGTLPAGLTFDTATAVISGTPTAVASAALTYRVLDNADNATAEGSLTLQVAQSAPFAVGDMAASYPGTVGKSLSVRPTVSGAKGPVSWRLSGSLPSWATFDLATGAIAGNPTAPALTPGIQLTVTDGASTAQTTAFALDVRPADGLTVTMPDPLTADEGKPFSGKAPTVANAVGSSTFALGLGSLPAGLAVSSATGAIQGTTTSIGTWGGVTVRATDSSGAVAASNPFSVTVNPFSDVAADMPSVYGTVGSVLSAVPTTRGLTAPFVWALVTGSLPTWARLDPVSGVITGTPTLKGVTSGLVVEVADGSNRTLRTKAFSLTVADAPAFTARMSSMSGKVNAPLSGTASSTGAKGGVTWRLASGTLQNGLALNASTGIISGTPTQVQVRTGFVLEARDTANDATVTTDPFTVTVSRTDLKVTDGAGPYVTHAGHAVSTDAPSVSGALGSVTWDVQGSLPAGTKANAATGVLSGTPTSIGDYPGLVPVVTDAFDGTSANGPGMTVKILGPPQPTMANASGTEKTPFAASPQATSVIPPLQWTLAAGTLPPWATLNAASGTISGTPPVTGTYPSLALRVTDAQQESGVTAPFSIDILPAPPTPGNDATLSARLTPLTYRARVGKAFTASTPTLLNAVGSVTWTSVSGSIPTWSTLAATSGVLSGMPDAPGSAGFALRGTQADGKSADTGAVTVTTLGAPTVAMQSSYTGRVKARFSAVPDVTNVIAPGQWTVSGATLPAWAKVGQDGGITGTPDAPWTGSNLILSVSDADGISASSGAFSIRIGPGISIADLPASLVVRQGNPATFTPRLVNGLGAITWKVAGLPPGLTADASGKVTGKPTSPGSYSVYFDATDAYDGAIADTVTLSLRVLQPLAITADDVLQMHQGSAYVSKAPGIVGQQGNLTWSLSGTLPSWATFNSGIGNISGTAGPAGTTTGLVLTATDSFDQATDNHPFSIQVLPALNVVDMATNYTGRFGFDFVAVTPTMLNAVGTVSWAWGTTATPPSWLRLNAATGQMTGKPDVLATTDNLTVVGTDATGSKGSSIPFHMNVYQQAVVTVDATTNRVRVGKSASIVPKVTGLVGTGTWSLTGLSGTLPAGISIDPATGTVGGTVTGPGSATFSIRVTDSRDGQSFDSDPVSVEAIPALTLSGLQPSYRGLAGQSLDTGTPTTANSKGAVTVSASISAPAGMTLSPEGRLYGIPSGATPKTSVALTAVDGYDSATATLSYDFEVIGTLTATLATEPHLRSGGDASTASAAPQAQNASSPADLRWSLSDGTLPSGITVDPVTGRLVGTAPAVSAIATFGNVRLMATDGDKRTAKTLPFAVSVAPGLGISGVPSSVAATELADSGFTPSPSGIVGTASWSLTGQPAGLVADATSGAVSGQPIDGSSVNSPYAARLVLRDSWDGATYPAAFQVTVADADPTPDTFSFPAVPNAAGGSAVTSQTVTLTGMTTSAPLTVTAGGSYPVRIGVNGATPSTSVPSRIPPNASITLSLDAAPGTDGGTRTVTVKVATVSATWTVVSADTTPGSVSFTDANLVAASTAVASNTVTITGITASAPVSVTGDGSPMVSVAGGAFATSGTVSNGQTLQLRLTSNPSETGVKSTATVNVGGVTATWNVTTRDTVPDAFSLPAIPAQSPGTLAQVGPVAITGLTAASPASVTGEGNPQIRIGGQTFPWATTGMVSPGQSIEVRLTTAIGQGVTRTATVTIGGVSATWGAATASITAPDSLSATEGDTVSFSATTTLDSPTWSVSGNPAWMTFATAGGTYATSSVSGDIPDNTPSTVYAVVLTATQGNISVPKTVNVSVASAAASFKTVPVVRSGATFSVDVTEGMPATGSWSATAAPADVTGVAFTGITATGATLTATAPANTGTTLFTRTLNAIYTGPPVATGAQQALAIASTTLTVHPALTVASMGAQSWPLGRGFSIPAPQVTGKVGALTWALLKDGSTDITASFGTTAALCPGLSFSTQTGAISGNPTATCSLSLTHQVSDDGSGNTALSKIASSPAAFPFAVTPATATASVTAPSVTEGDTVAFSVTTSIPYPTWTMTFSGTNPGWLTGTGQGDTYSVSSISGDVGSATTYRAIITASNGTLSAQTTVNVTVNPASVTLSTPNPVRSYQSFSAGVSGTVPNGTFPTPTSTPADLPNLAIGNGTFTGTAPGVGTTSGGITRTLTAVMQGPIPSNGATYRAKATGTATLTTYAPFSMSTGSAAWTGKVGTSTGNLYAGQTYGNVGVIRYELRQGGVDISDKLGDAARCPGLSFSRQTGYAIGTPQAQCSITLTVFASDDGGAYPNLAATYETRPFGLTISSSNVTVSVPPAVVEGGAVTIGATTTLAAPVTWTVSGLPNWMTGTQSGTSYNITGTSPDVSAVSTSTVTLTASSSAGSGSGSAVVSVTPATAYVFANGDPDNKPVRSGGSFTLTLSQNLGGSGAWTATGDTGVTFSGVSIYGINGSVPANNGAGPTYPNVTGTYTASTAPSTGARAAASATRAVTVYPPMQVGGVAASYAVTEGGSFSLQPSVTYPIGKQTWTISSGVLPPGLTIDASTGTVSGTVDGNASANSPYPVTISITDQGNVSALQKASITTQFNVSPTVLLAVSQNPFTVSPQPFPNPGACSTLTVTNQGAQAATPTFSLDNGDFQTCAPASGTTCSGSLLAGQSCVVGYMLNAPAEGYKTGTLAIAASGGQTINLPVKGTASTPTSTSGYQVFSTAGTFTFTPPRANLTVRVLIVGGGAGGSGFASSSYKSQGGGSGYYTAQASYTLTGAVSVRVGAAATGSTGGATTSAGSSAFGNYSVGSASFANGGSGGGGVLTNVYTLGDGGSAGANGQGTDTSGAGIYGTGLTPAPDLGIFRYSTLAYGSGGQGASTSRTADTAGGGGGGGVLLNGTGGSAASGAGLQCNNGTGGLGFGAGGGGGCYSGAKGVGSGGAGTSGLVYVEWD